MAKKKLKQGTVANAKPRGEVSLPAMGGGKVKASQWDMGPATYQQNHLKVVEDAHWTDPETGEKVNPNGVKRARRLCWFDHYHFTGWKSEGRELRLSQRQHRAAELLHEAFSETLRSKPAIRKVQVDTTPNPGRDVAIQVDRLGGYHKISKHVPKFAAAYIDHVVLQNLSMTSMPGGKGRGFERYMARLADGLDSLADKLDL